jgi:hypothetical protein
MKKAGKNINLWMTLFRPLPVDYEILRLSKIILTKITDGGKTYHAT